VSLVQSFMSDREYLTEPLDEDEERAAAGYVHPAVRSYMYSPMGESRSLLRLSVFVYYVH
jgi:hypothetical protein